MQVSCPARGLFVNASFDERRRAAGAAALLGEHLDA